MNSNFQRIMEGLSEVVEIEAGRADPSTYRVYVRDSERGRVVHVPGMRIGPAETKPRALAVSALLGGRRHRYQRPAKTALFAELYARRHGETARAGAPSALHAAE